MKQLFSKMLDALGCGENVVLCRIVASSGAVPRGAGACMAVFADGSTLGTAGGGAVERLSAEQAMQVHAKKESACRGFCLASDQVADIGMICGGDVTMYFQFFAADDETGKAFLRAALELLACGKNAWRITRLQGGLVTGEGLYDEEHGLRFLSGIPEEILRPLLIGKAIYRGGEPAYAAEPICRAGVVYLFGGGHVGRALVPLLAETGFRVCVFDDRESYAKPENYPRAERVVFGDYLHIGEKISLTADDYAVIMTPGHQADREVLLQVLQTDTSYVGCIGSRNKAAKTNVYLLEHGVSEKSLARIHCPIGIEIYGETPAEIAVSVTAELIRHRAIASGAGKQTDRM